MNRFIPSFFIPALLSLLVVSFGQEAEPAEAKAKLVFAFQAPDGTAVEGKLHKTVAFESIAGVLQIPGEKIHGITFDKEEGTTLKLSDGSKITGKIVQKTLPFALFVGEVDVPLAMVAAFGEKSEVHQPRVAEIKAPAFKDSDYFEYKVIKGDTMLSIAGAFITTVKDLEAANPGVKGNNLKPGVTLRIPPLR